MLYVGEELYPFYDVFHHQGYGSSVVEIPFHGVKYSKVLAGAVNPCLD